MGELEAQLAEALDAAQEQWLYAHADRCMPLLSESDERECPSGSECHWKRPAILDRLLPPDPALTALVYHGGIAAGGYRWVVYRAMHPPGCAEAESAGTFDTPEAAQDDYQRCRLPAWPPRART